MRRRRTAPNPPHDAYTIPVSGYRTQITIPPSTEAMAYTSSYNTTGTFCAITSRRIPPPHRRNEPEQNGKHIPVAGITVNRRHRTGHRESGKTCRIGNTISKKDKFPFPAGSPEMPETDAHRCRRHQGKYDPIRPAQGKRRKYTRQHIAENTASHCRHPLPVLQPLRKKQMPQSPVFQKPPTLKTYRTFPHYICSTEAIRRIVVPV